MPGAFKGNFWGTAGPGTPEGMLSFGKKPTICAIFCVMQHRLNTLSPGHLLPSLCQCSLSVWSRFITSVSLLFFPSHQPAAGISIFCVISWVHMQGDKRMNLFTAQGRGSSADYSLFTRYFPPYNVEAQLLKCYLYRIFQFLLFIPNLHHLGLLCFWVSTWFVVEHMNYLHMPKKA